MPTNYALYTSKYDHLPQENMLQWVDGLKPEIATTERGLTFTYRWPDLEILVSVMPRDQIANHLRGFEGYVRNAIYLGNVPERGERIIRTIRAVRLVVGVEIHPAVDGSDRADVLIGRMCGGLRPTVFFSNCLYDWNSRLLLAPDQSFDPEAEPGEIHVPLPPASPATARQQERAARSFAVLDAKKVPRYRGPLFVSDDAAVSLRNPADVARRLLVLWAIALRADGAPRAEMLAFLDQRRLWPYVSPKETAYIRNANPDPHATRSLVWRLEAVWTLLWALGRLDDMGWPASMCDVPGLVKLMKPIEADSGFVLAAKLRPKAEILDAADLTMRFHWTIRDAWLAKRPIRSDLNWTAGEPDQFVTQSPIPSVIEQRHHTLNWLIQFGGDDWDNVDTPT